MLWRRMSPLWQGDHLTEEALSARLDGALSAGEREEVDEHLARCRECRARFEGMERVVALLRAAGPEPVPRPFTLPEEVPTPVPRVRPLLRMGTALAGLLLVALAGLLALDLAGVGEPRTAPAMPPLPPPAPTPLPAPEGGAKGEPLLEGPPLVALQAERAEAPAATPTAAATPVSQPPPGPPARQPPLRWWPVEVGLAVALLILGGLLRWARREPLRPCGRL